MSKNQGWVAIHRSLDDDWIWNTGKFSYGQAWVDMIMAANHSENIISINKTPTTIKRGQFHTSEKKLAEKWHMNRKTVKSLLTKLKKDGKIDYSSNNYGTTITIVNYNKYQFSPDSQLDSCMDNKPDYKLDYELPSALDTNNNIKKAKNANKETNYPDEFESLWNLYPRKTDKAKAYSTYCSCREKYTDEELLDACKNFSDYHQAYKTPEQYIRTFANFYGGDQLFTEYLTSNGYTPSKKRTPNSGDFNNFPQRNIDFESLER